MAVRAYQKLKEYEPQHELVALMESEEISNDDFINKLWDKEESWQKLPGSMVAMHVETTYFLKVRTLLKEKYNIIL